jgi:uncharacterized protein
MADPDHGDPAGADLPGADLAGADLASAVAGFGVWLRAAGLPVGPDRCERFARAVTLVRPVTLAQLRACARATLVAEPTQLRVLDRVFDQIFGGLADPADDRGDPADRDTDPSPGAGPVRPAPAPHGSASTGPGNGTNPDTATEVPGVASAAERLASRDFSELSPVELAQLAVLMGQLRVATPPRRSRRRRAGPHAHIDLRATLRLAHRSGGDPLRLVRRRPRDKPRRLVALCDISGSMQPYARAMLQLLYCAAGTNRAEVFSFATRLTRLTPALAEPTPGLALQRAGRSAPDWSGGTRIGAAIKDFIDQYGRRGLARGAVVLIISDGWETGDVTDLGRQMARLSRLAYRIVWMNPRTQSPRYQPLVGGMAVAWPHCDAVVSAHKLDALVELVAALGDPVRRRTHLYR